MATTDRVTIQLYVDDQGTVKIREARVETEALGQAGEAAGRDFAAGMDLSVAALGRKVAALAAAAGGVYGLQRAIQAALRVTEDYQMSVISIAASLTDLAKDQSDPAYTYARNLLHAKEMYTELEREAAKHFAGAQQMQEAYNILVNKGYNVRKEEIPALGLVVDKILLMTKGQNSQIQIAQEIRALLDGQARATSQVAMLIRDQVGPGWEDLVKKHQQAGTLLEWLASLWPGLNLAVTDVTNTLTAQGTTLATQAAQIARNSGLWQDGVEILKEINKFLKEHGQEIGEVIATGWAVVKDAAGGVLTVVRGIVGWLKTGWDYLAGWRREMAAIAQQRADLGAGLGLDLYPGVEQKRTPEQVIADKMEMNQRLAREAERYKQETYQMWLRQQPVPETRTPPGAGGGGGGGGGGRDTAQQYANLISTLQGELTRLAEGSFGAVIGWYEKTLEKIRQYAKEGKAAEEGIALARQVAAQKSEKIEEEFSRWQARALGDRYAQIAEEEQQLLKKYGLNRAAMVRLAEATGKSLEKVEGETQARLTAIQQAMADKRAATEAAKIQERLGRVNKYLQDLAGATPLLSQQLTIEEKILQLEGERERQSLRQQLLEHKITQEEYQQLQNLQREAEKRRQEALSERRLMTEGAAGGVQAWALGQRRAAETRGAQTTLNMLESAKQFSQEAVSGFFKGLVRGDTVRLEDFGLKLADMFLDGISKLAVEKLSDIFAEVLGGAGEELTGALTEGAASVTSAGDSIGEVLATGAQGLVQAGQSIGNILSSVLSGIGGIFGFFHGGGLVMHQGGVLVAHRGLAVDERLILAQTGEGVLSRQGMRALEARYGPEAFGRLNRGEPLAGPAGPITVQVNVSGGGQQTFTQAFWRQQARAIRAALSRELLREGRIG